MKRLIIIVSVIVVFGAVAVLISSCVGASANTKDTPSATYSPFSDLAFQQTPSLTDAAKDNATVVNPIIGSEMDYDKLIPEIKFGSKLIAFVENDGKGKTYLYSDVKRSNVKGYIKLLEEEGYELELNEGLQDKESFNSILYNNDTEVYVWIKYQSGMFTLKVYIEE